MRVAMAYAGEREFKLEHLPIPDLFDGEVLIRVKGTSINRGNVTNWRAGVNFPDLPRPISSHMTGEVAAVGKGVTRVKPGARVKVDPVLSCGKCWECITDNRLRCANIVQIGASFKGDTRALWERFKSGATAEYARVPESACWAIPDNVSFEVSTHLGTAATSLCGIRRAGLNQGDTLVLTGAGGANGSVLLKMAPLMGVGRVIAISRSRAHLEKAAKLAPGMVGIIALEDLPADWRETGALTAAIRDLTSGRGADALIDFLPAGVEATRQSLSGLKKGGKAVLFGGVREELKLRYIEAFPLGNLQLEGMNGHAVSDFLILMRWLEEGRLVLDEFVSHRIPLEQINDAVRAIDNNEPYTWMAVQP